MERFVSIKLELKWNICNEYDNKSNQKIIIVKNLILMEWRIIF